MFSAGQQADSGHGKEATSAVPAALPSVRKRRYSSVMK
jgi:hypothetical protein